MGENATSLKLMETMNIFATAPTPSTRNQFLQDPPVNTRAPPCVPIWTKAKVFVASHSASITVDARPIHKTAVNVSRVGLDPIAKSKLKAKNMPNTEKSVVKDTATTEAIVSLRESQNRTALFRKSFTVTVPMLSLILIFMLEKAANTSRLHSVLIHKWKAAWKASSFVSTEVAALRIPWKGASALLRGPGSAANLKRRHKMFKIHSTTLPATISKTVATLASV
mmetsp:Transcript_6314/g.9578  ORF Transcript_6314/g.9578 Transcript_6314/m.9578 type:complete len:224 (-) Transcript_6314:1106-1777(-)